MFGFKKKESSKAASDLDNQMRDIQKIIEDQRRAIEEIARLNAELKKTLNDSIILTNIMSLNNTKIKTNLSNLKEITIGVPTLFLFSLKFLIQFSISFLLSLEYFKCL